MDWRNKLIINSVVNGLVDQIECQVNGDEFQIGHGQENPESVVFEWKKLESFQPKYNEKFKRKTYQTQFFIKHNFGAFTDLFQIEKNIDEMYNSFMKNIIEKYNDNDIISVNIKHENLQDNVFVPPFKKRFFDEKSFFNALYEVSQSNSSFLISGKLKFEVNVTRAIRGSGKKGVKAPQTKEEFKTASTSIITIKNEDNGCAFYAIAVAIKKLEGCSGPEWQNLRRNEYKSQEKCAMSLAKNCGFDLKTPITIDDFDKIQQKLPYQLTIIDGTNKFNRLFVGPYNPNGKIYILHSKTVCNNFHFDSIVNIKGFMGSGKFYCEHCHKVESSSRFKHKCAFTCELCLIFPPCVDNNTKIFCQLCNFEFKGQCCYDQHLFGSNNLCKNRKKCHNCHQIYFDKKHSCDIKICKKCNEKYRLEKHYCYLKKVDFEKLNKDDSCEKIIVSYDIEAQQNQVENNEFIHKADLLISMTTCSKCWDIDNNQRRGENCELCGIFKNIFFGLNCITRFGDYIYKNLAKIAAKNNASVYIFAHNAKGYDNHFILNDLFQRNFENTKVIMCGNKVLKASVANVNFLDSLLMFQQPLASLPKAFGFENLVTKGYFPHNFHNEENLNYIGPIPDKVYFGTEFMKSKQLKEFEKWYEIEKIKSDNNFRSFNLKCELIKYCENDVLILLNCVQVFRKIYKTVTGIDPITRCFTLASMGLEIFKAKILPHHTIGVTPIKGYGNRGSFSKIGNCWLDYQQKLLNCEIEREIGIDNYIVDGFKDNNVFEYNGCYYHCHDCIFREKRNEKFIERDGEKQSPNEIFQLTMKKAEHLRKRGFNLVEEWDCNLAKKRRLDKDLNNYFKERYEYYRSLEKYGGVNIRESFFGGRTNNIKFHCDVTNDPTSKILYYDFRSLYPTVLKYKPFPLGHPKVINEDFDYDIDNYFGFVKCVINPPNDLYIPVLPLKTKSKKLIFPLCSKCCKDLNTNSCEHSKEERQLVGTWTTIELSYALKRGYEIEKILEVYHYSNSSKDIFSEYINMWLKFKQQSDGWPTWVNSEADKKKYVENFLQNEGVELSVDDIEKNPALRFIAKLFLNTLWGKLAQRPNLKQTTVCTEYHEYWRLACDESKLIKGELMINDNCLLVNWENVDEEDCNNQNTSLAIASFVTSYARIELMKVIDEIEEIPGRILYMDTDSVIFKYKEGQPKPKTDDYLGCLADEISKDYGENAVCTKFCSLGPKVYAMEIWPENSTVPVVPIKVKGITLTDKAMDIIKMESMTKLAEEYINNNGDLKVSSNLKIPQMEIRPNNMQVIKTRYFEKTFRAMSNKRRIKDDDTLPYGFVDKTEEDFIDLICN